MQGKEKSDTRSGAKSFFSNFFGSAALLAILVLALKTQIFTVLYAQAEANAFAVYIGLAVLGGFLLLHSAIKSSNKSRKGSWTDVVKFVYWAFFIALLFRSFLFQPFHIPSGSMKPTLLIGDYLFVSKYSYGYSKYSFPLNPEIYDGRKFYSEPKRGDIVVFKVPSNPSSRDVLIKRLVGLPGDEMQMKDGVLQINGKAVGLDDDGRFYAHDQSMEIQRFVETLPNGIKHWTLDLGNNMIVDNTDIYKVPPGHFFMMGDNRDQSEDSRFPVDVGGPGFVPAEDLIGRAEIVLFASNGTWNPLEWGYNRFFTRLR